MIRNARWLLGILMYTLPIMAQDTDQKPPVSKSPGAQTNNKATEARPVVVDVQFQDLVNRLVAHGDLETFGMQVVEADPVLRAQLDLDAKGVVVVSVTPAGLADQSGLKAKDVLTRLGQEPIEDVEKLAKSLAKLSLNSVEVGLIREGVSRTVSLVGPAHVASNRKYWIGVTVSPVDATLRSHLKPLPPESGLVATEVVAESPAAKSGIQKNDILIKFQGKLLGSQELLVKSIQENKTEPASMELLRRGKVETVKVTPDVQVATSNPVAMFQVVNKEGTNHAFQFYYPTNNQALRAAEQIAEAEKQIKLHADAVYNIVGPRQEVRTRFIPQGNNAQPWVFKDMAQSEVEGRLEAQMKELSSKLDEIRKAIDSIKSAEAK